MVDRRERPELGALQSAAAAAGCQLDVRLLPAEPELVALAHDQLDLEPTDRLKALLGLQWPGFRDALVRRRQPASSAS